MSWALEHLRALVRRGGESGLELAVDVAQCLEEIGDDPALVMAARRACALRPGEGPLWWLCSRVLCAADSAVAAEEAADLLLEDPTLKRLVDVLPFPHDEPVVFVGEPAVVAEVSAVRPDLDLVAVYPTGRGPVRHRRASDATVRVADAFDVAALAPTHVLVMPAWASTAGVWAPAGLGLTLAGVPEADAWLVVPRGRALPEALAGAMARRIDPLDADVEEIAPERFGAGVGPHGLGPVRDVLAATDCPVAAELLRLD